jgi:Calcineurin-like phosphoesterase
MGNRACGDRMRKVYLRAPGRTGETPRARGPVRFSAQCLAAALAVCSAPAWADEGAFSFAALGDTPYFAFEEVRLEKIIDEINAENPAFVVHVGDIKSGRDRCDDAIYLERKRLFDRFDAPFVLLAGDNDWTDCFRQASGGYDPVERLQYWRRMFHARDPALLVERQGADPAFAAYVENLRWVRGVVMFMTLHVVGSNNNFGRTGQADAEYRGRSRADLQWLRQGFELARTQGLRGVVVAMHADPRFELSPGARARTGYADLVRELAEQSLELGQPVLLIHGDGHVYRLDHPLSDAAGHPLTAFTRLEVLGSPRVGWVKVTVDPARADLFSFDPRR